MLFKNPFRRSARSPTRSTLLRSVTINDIFPEGYVPLSDNEAIRRCVYKIADLVSNMTIMLMENGENGDRRIKNELSKKIDIEPNSNMGRKNFIFRIVTEMCMTGNCAVYPHVKNELISDLEFMKDCTYLENGGSYIVNCGGKAYRPDDVLHFVLNPSISCPYKGEGVLPLLRRVIEDISQANATKRGFLKSNWKPSLIITVNTDSENLIDPKKRSNILRSYTETTSVGEPWLIPDGEVDVKTIQPLTLKDLAIQEGLTFDLRTVASAMNIPPFMLGIGEFDKGAYNNFVTTTIMSYAIIIQQELTKKLLLNPNWYFRFNPKSLLQYDLSEKKDFVRGMVSGGMLTRNEGRNEFDYSPVDDEGMNEFIVLENYIPVSKVGDQKKLEGGDNDNG